MVFLYLSAESLNNKNNLNFIKKDLKQNSQTFIKSIIENSLETECKQTIDMLEKVTTITTATDDKRNELEQDAKDLVSVASEKMENLKSKEIASYIETGNTPINKPISKSVDLVRSLSQSAMREQYKLLKTIAGDEVSGRTSSSPRKRKTSDDETSSRSSVESIPTAPVVPVKKVKENVNPVKTNVGLAGKLDPSKNQPSKSSKDAKALQSNNINLK
jgi:hypothetical protein